MGHFQVCPNQYLPLILSIYEGCKAHSGWHTYMSLFQGEFSPVYKNYHTYLVYPSLRSLCHCVLIDDLEIGSRDRRSQCQLVGQTKMEVRQCFSPSIP